MSIPKNLSAKIVSPFLIMHKKAEALISIAKADLYEIAALKKRNIILSAHARTFFLHAFLLITFFLLGIAPPLRFHAWTASQLRALGTFFVFMVIIYHAMGRKSRLILARV